MRSAFSLVIIYFFCTAILVAQSDSIAQLIEKYIDRHDPALPIANVFFEKKINDISLCVGPDKTYYLTGTIGDKLGVHQGIMVWASRDLKEWNLVGRNSGYVWTFDDDAVPWQKEISIRNGWKQRGIIAPKIHFFNNTFWITYTNSNSNQSGILKSESGRAQGPYKEVSGDKPLVKGEAASLFQDTDGAVYFLWGNGLIQRMNEGITGFAISEPRALTATNGQRLSMNNLQLSKIDGQYVLSGSLWVNSDLNKSSSQHSTGERVIDNRYDGVVAVSNTLLGNYRYNNFVFQHCGGGHLFESLDNQLYYVFSGADMGNPMAANPSMLNVEKSESGDFKLQYKMPFYPTKQQPIVYVSQNGNNSNGASWDNAFTSVQRAVDQALKGAQIWIARGTYDGPVEINLREGLYLMGGFMGNEKELEERDPAKHKVIITGRNFVKNVIAIKSSSYIRIDGITVQGGNATGGSIFQQYGGGVHILGGGETIRLVNCRIVNNKASQDGGGLYASIGASPLVINCTFNNNVAMNNGGAVATYANTPNGYKSRIYNSIFDYNLAHAHGGAIFYESNKRDFGLFYIVNCLIVNNTTFGENGTITLNGTSGLVMANTTMAYNKGTSLGAVIGSMGKVPAKTRIYNSLFYGNNGGFLFAIEGEAENGFTDGRNANIWVQFTNCLFEDNGVNAIVQRNFDKRRWLRVDALNQSVMGLNCLTGDPFFVNHFEGNYRLKAGSAASGKGTSMYYFQYNLDGKPRSSSSVNIGCY
jgi:xylan 1,4-beta-xylosidase